MDTDKLIGLTVLLVTTIGPIATITFYWTTITTFIYGVWHTFTGNSGVQCLVAQMFADKTKEYIIGNVAYVVVGIIFNVLPFNNNGNKMFWIIYGVLLFVINGIIAAI